MSKRRVKKYPASFKARVVLAVLKNEKTISQIGSEFCLDPKNIHNWRKEFLANAELVFDKEKVLTDYLQPRPAFNEKELALAGKDYAEDINMVI